MPEPLESPDDQTLDNPASDNRSPSSLDVLVADDNRPLRLMLRGLLKRRGHVVEEAEDGLDAQRRILQQGYDLALVDVNMGGMNGLELLAFTKTHRPELAVVIITGTATFENAVEALRNGAVDFLKKPFGPDEVDAMLARVTTVRSLRNERTRLAATIGYVQRDRQQQRLLGESEATAEVRRQIQMAVEARCDRILITGDTGTGKEVVAREIHRLGSAQNAPFIAVCCPAIPESLIESELFGHEKGAFTGANEARAGCFELGDGGTVFLDEISELAPTAQAKILRALETRQVRRIGGKREESVSFRLVAATNAALEQLIETNRFRADLYYRLNGFVITLRPLRERAADILPLARAHLEAFAASRGLPCPRLGEDAEVALLAYAFPGNVRELRNIIERAAIVQKQVISAADLHLPAPRTAANTDDRALVPLATSSSGASPAVAEVPQGPGQTDGFGFGVNDEGAADGERERIIAALKAAHWNQTKAAQLLGLTYSQFRYKRAKYRIEV
jgi:DNA-binding NtrC family response regulator